MLVHEPLGWLVYWPSYVQMGRGKERGGNHGGRGSNNSRAWRESIDEINHVPEAQDMSPMI